MALLCAANCKLCLLSYIWRLPTMHFIDASGKWIWSSNWSIAVTMATQSQWICTCTTCIDASGKATCAVGMLHLVWFSYASYLYFLACIHTWLTTDQQHLIVFCLFTCMHGLLLLRGRVKSHSLMFPNPIFCWDVLATCHPHRSDQSRKSINTWWYAALLSECLAKVFDQPSSS
jgi:hypothetical protein